MNTANTDTTHDDNELFTLIAEGNKPAFTNIFVKYTPQLLPFISRMVRSEYAVDEVLQEIFMRAWINREKLAAINDPKGWIFRQASNVCYLYFKRLLIDNKLVNNVSYETTFQDNEVIETSRLHTLASDFHHAVMMLDPDQKKVYQLSREEGRSIPEISEALETSPNHVRNLLGSSLESIQAYLASKGHSL